VAFLDLLERQPPLLLHEIDQAEVARSEDHHLAVGDVVLRTRLRFSGRRAWGLSINMVHRCRSARLIRSR